MAIKISGAGSSGNNDERTVERWGRSGRVIQLLLVADGSGLVPLTAMLRHRAAKSSKVDARLLLSTGSPAEVLYRSELMRLAAGDGLAVHHTFTRDPPAA